jgi:hypothetical protein
MRVPRSAILVKYILFNFQVLQELHRQYVRLELALEQHHLRPLQARSPVRCNSEESDNVSTSADDGSVFSLEVAFFIETGFSYITNT